MFSFQSCRIYGLYLVILSSLRFNESFHYCSSFLLDFWLQAEGEMEPPLHDTAPFSLAIMFNAFVPLNLVDYLFEIQLSIRNVLKAHLTRLNCGGRERIGVAGTILS